MVEGIYLNQTQITQTLQLANIVAKIEKLEEKIDNYFKYIGYQEPKKESKPTQESYTKP